MPKLVDDYGQPLPPIGGTRLANGQPPQFSPSLDLNGARIIVTGGAGFVGSNLVRTLKEQFSATVIVIDNLWRGSLSNLEGLIDLETEFFDADLTDMNKCHELLRDAHVVYHLADIVAGVDYVFDNQLFVFRQNLLINTNVLAACRANGIRNYIYVGTACSFPQHLQMVPMSEHPVALHEDVTYPAEPESSYGWSKLMGEYEASLAQQSSSGKLNVGILRLHNVYGPGSPWDPQRSQALPSLIRKAILSPKEPFSVWGSGEQYRDFIFIDDVVRALLLVAQRGMNQGVVQIGTGVPTTLKNAATVVSGLAKDLMGKQIEPFFDASKPEGDRGRIAVGDRAKAVLGWEAQVGIEAGLRTTFEWILSQMHEQQPTPALPVASAPSAAAAGSEELPFLPQMQPWFDDEEADALDAYMHTGAYLTEFRQTEAFEAALARYVGCKHAIAVNNGTVSLTIALNAMGVRPNSNHAVLVPDWTMVASPNSVQMAGAVPIFMDVDPVTYCIDIAKVKRALEDGVDSHGLPIAAGLEIKAVMHVSMNARSNDVAGLRALCDAHGVGLLEDSAQALGSFHHGQHLGTFGHVGSFSFSSPKIISTGQGGALVTDDDDLAARIKRLKDFGRDTGGNDSHSSVGGNFKYTDMQGVIGVVQMRKLPWRVERIGQIWKRYADKLAPLCSEFFPETARDDDPLSSTPLHMLRHEKTEPGWIPWFIDIYTARPADRDKLAQFLRTKGVGTRNVYPPIHTQEAYTSPEFADQKLQLAVPPSFSTSSGPAYPVTSRTSKRGLWLPSSTKLTDADIDRVCDAVFEFFEQKAVKSRL